MAVRYMQRELYGGAIVADLPVKFLDASDLRQIPDHQEVFLSDTTLTSIIFELNTYQQPAMVTQQTRDDNNHFSSQDENKKASTWHFLDPIATPDRVDSESPLTPPNQVTMAQSSLVSFPSYVQAGTIVTLEPDRTSNNTRSILPNEWQQSPPTTSSKTKVYQLLVRLEEYDTDLCVRVNVPLKEFTGIGAEGMSKMEMDLGQEIVERIVASLDVKSFDLFG